MSVHSDNQGAGPLLAVTMGDPAGIGPEIVVKALADARVRAAGRFFIFGSSGPLTDAARLAGIAPFWRLSTDDRSAPPPAHGEVLLIDDGSCADTYPPQSPGPTSAGGAASFHWVQQAIEAAAAGRIDGIVTAPISKTSWNLAGAAAGSGRYPGHTELFGERLGAPGAKHGMLFVGPRLRVMLATIHVPLMQVAATLTTPKIVDAIELAAAACTQLGVPRPRIAVCGLNPHAGEGGILGEEDQRLIAPAVAAARGAGIDATGPWPGDTLFGAALIGGPKQKFDCIVAMYHDQGLIPAKLIDGERSVNVTVGLSTVRTSPAHGTAFDIAGRNLASAESMKAALELAAAIVRARAGESAGRR